ncbi:hypothetical protein M8445_16800 (plasmid) [Deinococcus aquaticus]|uniref:Uncharacterized protein n=2 Tax=Deinococcus aquaticus TaxID=328692 RepID=A0ABY7V685_9DEIO|nr:hypothetical protein [Deinococcus aquaticus]WDA60625.1 hypothetical protein M8445_16800 [Deinococcus aquaticus]
MRRVISCLEDVLAQAQQLPDVAVLVVVVHTDPNPDEEIDRVHAFVHAPAGQTLLLDATRALLEREANPLTRQGPP